MKMSRFSLKFGGVLALGVLALAGCVLKKHGPDGADWPDYDGPTTTHFSPLDQINDHNVSRLGLAWHVDLDVGGSSLTAPIAVDGVVYLAAGASHTHAIDAVTG